MSNNQNNIKNMAKNEQNPQQAKAPFNSFTLSFQPCLTEAQITELRTLVDNQGKAGGVESNSDIPVDQARRSRICWLSDAQKYKWAYDIAWAVACKANEQFQFDIRPINEAMQVAMYDASNMGFYDWHPDIGLMFMHRKISISIPLSSPSEYKGGEFQILIGGTTCMTIPQTKGCPIVFPSFVWHRVTPVTQGTRYSLVAWIGGPNWR